MGFSLTAVPFSRHLKFRFSFNRFWLPRSHNTILRRIVDRIRTSLELKVVLQTAVDEVADLLQVDRCSFFWYFHDTHRVQIICESVQSRKSGIHAIQTPLIASSLGYYPMQTFGSLADAIAQGELVINHGIPRSAIVEWLQKLPFSQRSASRTKTPIFGSIANMLVPLKIQAGSIGFLACFSEQPRRWSAAEVELLQSIAQQLEIAIGQAQLYEKSQKQAQRERLVNRITAQTRQSFELETILKGAIAQLLNALAIDRCLVHLVEDLKPPDPAGAAEYLNTPLARQSILREKHLYEVCRPPFLPSVVEFDLSGPITQWVIQNRRPVAIADVAQDSRIGHNNLEYQQAEIKSSLVIPVQAGEELYAILYLNQCSQVRYWSKNDQKLAQAVADQLAISIKQAHLYAQTQQQAAASEAQAKHLAETLHQLRLTQTQLIQSEKMSSLGRLVAGVAHEINNPINFISGNLPYVENYVQDLTDLIRAHQEQDNQSTTLKQQGEAIELDFLLADLPRILTSMKSGADRICQIVLSLRNFARLDEAQCKLVDIHEGLESTLLFLRSQFSDEMQVIRNYGQLPLVTCYPQQLNQAIMNILLNASEALKSWQGQKTIAIASDFVPATAIQPATVRIIITDTGPGIPRSIQSQIFDPFFTTKEVGQGCGLGLTVSYQTIVNQHQGRLECVSEVGLGAEFMIEIPVNQTQS
ncbi:MAG: histidine kinase [Leptolyngbya sp.]|nr:MAG: histidine kinase [Leptolyngbya sp.]